MIYNKLLINQNRFKNKSFIHVGFLTWKFFFYLYTFFSIISTKGNRRPVLSSPGVP